MFNFADRAHRIHKGKAMNRDETSERMAMNEYWNTMVHDKKGL
jgi:hypothetical protein